MRFLLTCVGGAGHLDPLLPIAEVLAWAGHEVAIAGSGNQMPRVTAAGFIALPTSPQRPRVQRERDRSPLAPVVARDCEVEFAENFADKGARRHVVAVGEHLASWRPDAVLREETDFGTVLAAELAGVPCATLLILASGTLSRAELVRPKLEILRREVGLDTDPGVASSAQGLVLSPYAPSFRDPAAILVPEVFSFRPSQVVPQSVGGLVYATLGTVFNAGSGDLFERLLSGLAEVQADVLVTVGRDVDPADFGPQPEHIRVEHYVAQEDVLPGCALMLSHGGSGSLMGALEHGLPSVLLPLGADQPHNARRAADLGIATVLDAAAVTPAEVSAAVTAALSDRSSHQRARDLKVEIDALPPVAATVPKLEQLAGH